MELSEFITKTDSTTGITCITNGDSFTLSGLIPNWIGCIRQGDIHPVQGVASFDLTLQINHDIFNILKSTRNDRMHIVVIRDNEDSLVSDSALSYIISSDSRICHLDTILKNLGFYSLYGFSQDCVVVKNSSMYAYISFSYRMHPEEVDNMRRALDFLSKTSHR